MTATSDLINFYTKEELELMREDMEDAGMDYNKAMRSYHEAEEEAMQLAIEGFNKANKR